MKTDFVLTMDEYLDQCSALAKPVSPPARDARHAPITAEDDLDSGRGAYGCRCVRWGHPCAHSVGPFRAKGQEVTSLVESKLRGKQKWSNELYLGWYRQWHCTLCSLNDA